MGMFVAKKLEDKEEEYYSALDVCIEYQIFRFKSKYKSTSFNTILSIFSKRDMELYLEHFLLKNYIKDVGFKSNIYGIIGISNLLNDIREEQNKDIVLFKGYKGGADFSPVFNTSIYKKCLDKLTKHKEFIIDKYTYTICSYKAKNGKEYKFIVRK